jgi:hypothetical protein
MEKKYTTQKRPKTPQTKSDGDGAWPERRNN